jgi:hypothetical protein
MGTENADCLPFSSPLTGEDEGEGAKKEKNEGEE